MSSIIWVGVERGACERLMALLPQATLVDPSREDCPPLNLLRTYRHDDGEREAIAGAFLSVVESENTRGWGPNLSDAIQVATLMALEWGDKQGVEITARDIVMLISDERERNRRYAWMDDPEDYARAMPDRRTCENAARKVQRIVLSKRMRRLLGETGGLDLDRDVFQLPNAAIVCCYDLGDLGAKTAGSLASLTCAAILHAGYRREQGADPVYVFADEFQLYASGVQEAMLTQLRRYGISLTVACQGLWQLSERVRDAVLQAGSLYCYRLHPKDAQSVGKWWGVDPGAFLNLRTASCLARELTDGKPSAVQVIAHDPSDPTRPPHYRGRTPFWVSIADAGADGILAACDYAARLSGATKAALRSEASHCASAARPDVLPDDAGVAEDGAAFVRRSWPDPLDEAGPVQAGSGAPDGEHRSGRVIEMGERGGDRAGARTPEPTPGGEGQGLRNVDDDAILDSAWKSLLDPDDGE